MIIFPATPELQEYCAKVEKETGFTIVTKEDPSLRSTTGLLMVHVEPLYDGTILRNNKTILVYFDSICLEKPLEHQRGIAHEATHGLLRYKHLYPSIKGNGKHEQLSSRIGTYIEDIVVNKIVADEGFNLFTKKNIDQLKNQLLSIRNKNTPAHHTEDSLLKSWNVILKIVQTWAYKEYYNVEPSVHNLLKNIIKALSSDFKQESKQAEKIINILKVHDIFSKEGYVLILQDIISEYDLDIELVY